MPISIFRNIHRFIKQHSAFAVITISLLIIGTLVAVFNVQGSLADTTVQQYDHYSELYFSAPNQLPQHIAAGKSVVVSFVISNHTGTTKTYMYQVVISENNIVQNKYEKEATLGDGEATTLSVTVTPKSSRTEKTVDISLVGGTQDIQFRSQP